MWVDSYFYDWEKSRQPSLQGGTEQGQTGAELAKGNGVGETVYSFLPNPANMDQLDARHSNSTLLKKDIKSTKGNNGKA